MSEYKFAVENTTIEARALIDVVGRAYDNGNIEKDEAGPIDWVMSRVNKKMINIIERNKDTNNVNVG